MADEGEYVQNGDVLEWKWAEGHEPKSPANTGGWVVPEGEFDPTSAPMPEVSPAERPQENPSPGLRVAAQAEPEVEAEVEAEEEVDLETLTKTELVEMADAAGIDSSGTKAELIERLAD